MDKLKLVVTGTGRCGTVYMARLLTSLGIACGHEAIFDKLPGDTSKLKLNHPKYRKLSYCSTHEVKNNNQGIPQWVDPKHIVAESSYMAVPHFNLIEDIPVVHVVRHPLKVISSFIGDINYFAEEKPVDPWQSKIYKFLPDLSEIPSQIERACYFYVKWNEAIESQSTCRPYFFSKVEHISKNPHFFEFINKPFTQEIFDGTNVNSFGIRSKNLTIGNIPEGCIKTDFLKKMKQYNYSKEIKLL